MKAKSLIANIYFFGFYTISLTSAAVQWERPLKLLGQPAAATQATRTIIIRPNTKYIRVSSGETIKFISNNNDFTWRFDGPEGPFTLSQIAPQGLLDRPIKGYIERNPLYIF